MSGGGFGGAGGGAWGKPLLRLAKHTKVRKSPANVPCVWAN